MATALAGVPTGIRPVIAPADVHDRYRASVPTGPGLACETLWTGHALLCFRVWESSRRRWVTQDDLEAWGVRVGELKEAVRAAAPAHLDLERRPVVDMGASWWVLADGDGWAAAGLLAPERIAEVVGAPFRAAVPSEGVFVAWKVVSPEVDHAMAVGVRELYEQQPARVSPMAWTWDDRGWAPFGQARPKPEPTKPTPADREGRPTGGDEEPPADGGSRGP